MTEEVSSVASNATEQISSEEFLDHVVMVGEEKEGGGESIKRSRSSRIGWDSQRSGPPVEEVTAADCRISRSAKGVAAGTLAAMSTVDNQPDVDLVDDTQVQVDMDPSWSAAAKERYRRNEARLWGLDP